MFKKCRNILRNEKGLTLIELLAVVVILGIIAAIAIPSIGSIIEKSRTDAVVADGQMLMNATRLAVINNDIELPAEGATLDVTATDLEDYLDKYDSTKYSAATVTIDSEGKITGASLTPTGKSAITLDSNGNKE
ncbi:prepilin-type N-terminal cleavage/methylation domain-containing protein [Sutcliffiella cohnii]